MRRSFNRICAVGLITLATLITFSVWLDSPPARAVLDHGEHALAAPSTSTDVSIMNIAFNPQIVTITAGSTVTWTNFDPFAHTTTSDDLGLWDSGILAPGLVFTHTFNTPGIFLYHCNIHSTMHGTVVVVNSASQPPTQVTIDGPTGGAFDTPYTFTATVHPLTATQPITYFWQATGQSSATHVGGGISDTIAFSWTAGITRVQWITVTASNASSSAGGTHLLIIDPIIVYLPLIFK